MTSDMDLPAEVIADIEANRKIAAIKRLRAHHGIGLKEAKEMVDDYICTRSPSSGHRIPETDSGIGRIIVMTIGVGLIYALYRYFS